MKGRGKNPRSRRDVSGVSVVRSFKRSRGSWKRSSLSHIPSPSASPQSHQSNASPRAGSHISTFSKRRKWRRRNSRVSYRPVSRRGRNQEVERGSRYAGQKRESSWSLSPSPQPQRARLQSQTAQDKGTPARLDMTRIDLDTQSQWTPRSGQDVTRCRQLHYGAYVGNETRNLEFKTGQGFYMKEFFLEHVCKYGCAFLNSGGGSLLVGVRDDGVVCGVHFNHQREDQTRQQVDWVSKLFHPPLLPHNYSLSFLPVVEPGRKAGRLKVLRLTFRASTVPTLYQIDQGKVYLRRDGSVQGPLGASVILEWSRQMWAGKVEQLERHLREAMSEKWFLVGQINGLLRTMDPLHQGQASSQPHPRKATPSRGRECKASRRRESSARERSGTRDSPPPVGSPHGRTAHNSKARHHSLESEYRRI